MSDARRRWIIAVGAALVVATVIAGGLVLWGGDDGQSRATAAASDTSSTAARAPSVWATADDFLAAVSTGDGASAGRLTDNPDSAAKTVTGVVRAMRPGALLAQRLGAGTAPADATTVGLPFRMTWQLGSGGQWQYESTVELTRQADRWLVHWTPTLVHPKLADGLIMALRGQDREERPVVVDRDGRPLLVWRIDGVKPADPSVAPLLLPAMSRTVGDVSANTSYVALVDDAGTELEKLYGAERAAAAKPIDATLSVPTQAAAQAAVDSQTLPTRLVAIDTNGEILAVAQNAAAGGEPKALNGQYPPGSTFKIATAAAVLQSGRARVDTMLPCPGTVTVDTRTIPNAGQFDLGQVPLRKAFAQSCNTTFGQLAADLPADALAGAAGQLGLNADFDIPGITTEAGAARPADERVARVEDGIGQGRITASPFGVALMSATVASGRTVTPKLWRDSDTTVHEGYQAPPKRVIDALRTMMREVVTGGTGQELKGLGAVYGKTGTAQFGDGSSAHGWFTGYRGKVAFAVLVEDAGTAAPAVAVSASFLGKIR